MEGLYAYYSQGEEDDKLHLDSLISVFSLIHKLYLHQLYLLIEVNSFAKRSIERAKNKQLPDESDLNPNMRYVNNAVWQILSADPYLEKRKGSLDISWNEEEELIRKIYNKIKGTKSFQDYLDATDLSFEEERTFAKKIFREGIIGFELLEHYYSEKNLYWEANIDLANRLVLDTIDDMSLRMTRNSFRGSIIIKDILTKDDLAFVKKLFKQTIKNNSEFENWIGEKAKNWDTDRIAHMDILLMKMALCEILEFNMIPIKVSLNEYIEISKYYSAPQSRGFINGILDKVIVDLDKNKKIQKRGRGLIDS